MAELRSSRPSLQGPAFRIIHTSDWHLGKKLDLVERQAEFEGFLDWLADALESEGADALIVAGDVFDVPSPPVWAQQLYYRFLLKARRAGISVVVTSGNHDSQQFLEAPRPVLAELGVHVSAVPKEDPADELVVLGGRSGAPAAIVAAVPFLREQDVRASGEGESSLDQGRGIARGISERYAASAAAAEALRVKLGLPLPLVAVGHLMASGAVFSEGDGIRPMYAGETHSPPGTAAAVAAEVAQDAEDACGVAGGSFNGQREFRVAGAWSVNTGAMAEAFDYTALGHIHRPQRAGGETVRYSGSPILLRFSEAGTRKSVALVELGGGGIRIEALFVPVFRELVPVKGDMAAVRAHLERLKERGSDAIVEVAVVGSPLDASVRDEVDAVVKGSRLEVTAVRNLSREAEIMDRSETAGVLLRDMDERQVFGRLLDEFAERIGPGERDGLLAAYEEILRTLDDEEEEGLAAKPAAAAPQSKGRPGGAPAGSGTAAAPEPEGPGTGGAEPEAAGTGGAGPEDAWPEGSPPDGSVPGGSAQEGPGEGAGGADAALGQPPRERGEGR